ncbi:MAG TPA: protein kinase [Myxococcaceae bacterium]|nr:protein kinase [Myxococcaceae bacterium]
MTSPSPKKQPIPFGRYLLLDRINIGGMAEVWRGKVFGAGGFERLVAIKRILPNIAEDEEFISMFQDEAKISVQLTHANICQIYELNRIGPSLYIAMEYVPGKDLRSIFERARKKGEPPPVPLVCYVIGKLCEGLDYAHRKKDQHGRDLNVVHRDVSPQNVLISFEGEVKVIDFGIAKAAGKVTKTQAGILKGKFGYMSPEQIRGLPLDRKSDVFAIGVCLYELLTGERLFVGESDFQVLEKVRKAEVLPPSTYNRKIPEALERIVLKALAKDPADRFQYASELADELQRFLITSDSIFSRKDLMQYMKSTFAEEVERERARMAEYADIKAPEGMLAEGGLGVPVLARTTGPILAAVPTPPSTPGVVKSASFPKLTAAAPVAQPREDEGTLVVDNSEVLASVEAAQPAVQPIVGSDPQTDPERSAGSSTDEPEPAEDGPISPVDETIVRHRPGAPTPVPTERGSAAPPPLPPRPKAAVPVAEEAPSAPSAAPPESIAGVPVLASIGAAPVAPPVAASTAPPDGAVAGVTPSLAPADVAPIEIPAARPAAAPEVASQRQPPPAASGDFPFLSPALSASGSSPTSELEALDRAAAQGTARSGRRVWPWALLAIVALGAASAAWVLIQEPATGRVVLDVSPPEARGRVRLTVAGADLGVPTHWPVVQSVRSGKVEILASADGFKPALVETTVGRGSAPSSVLVALQRAATVARFTVLPEPDDAEVRLDGQVVKRSGTRGSFVGELVPGQEHSLQIRRAGYRSVDTKVSARSAEEPVELRTALEPLEFGLLVSSTPPGAVVFSGERLLGVTPLATRVPATASALTFRKRCFETAQVPLRLPEQPGPRVPVRAALRKVPGCR